MIFLWGRSAINSFKPKEYAEDVRVDLYDWPTQQFNPTPTIWSIRDNQSQPEQKITATSTFIPTQTPWVVTATPEHFRPTPEPTPWYLKLDYSTFNYGWADKPGGEPDETRIAKMSYFWPPYAYDDPDYEINCDKVDGVLECEHMASGEWVVDWIGEAVACPSIYAFGTVIKIFDGYYTCRDRGGAIVEDGDKIWLDILYPYMPYYIYWGEEVQVEIWYP